MTTLPSEAETISDQRLAEFADAKGVNEMIVSMARELQSLRASAKVAARPQPDAPSESAETEECLGAKLNTAALAIRRSEDREKALRAGYDAINGHVGEIVKIIKRGALSSPPQPVQAIAVPEADASKWKTLAIGMGALFENIEAHCAVQTGKTGAAHAKEGQELRDAGRRLTALVRDALSASPSPDTDVSAGVPEELQRKGIEAAISACQRARFLTGHMAEKNGITIAIDAIRSLLSSAPAAGGR